MGLIRPALAKTKSEKYSLGVISRALAKTKSEEGSISILVFGFFAVVILASVVLTDISAIIVAQRSLIQATESAAQSAAHALDLDTYYQGKHSALSFLVSDASPVVPINCAAAQGRARQTLQDINATSGRSNGKTLRPEISNLVITDFQCNGREILITTAAIATLPISLSLFSFESIELSATAGTASIKKRAFSLFGINL